MSLTCKATFVVYAIISFSFHYEWTSMASKLQGYYIQDITTKTETKIKNYFLSTIVSLTTLIPSKSLSLSS